VPRCGVQFVFCDVPDVATVSTAVIVDVGSFADLLEESGVL